MFDLPTDTKDERKNAHKFRIGLLKNGFKMLQFSVYYRYCINITQSDKYNEYLSKLIPCKGNIRIFTFTDQQYLSHICIDNDTKTNEKVLDNIIQL